MLSIFWGKFRSVSVVVTLSTRSCGTSPWVWLALLAPIMKHKKDDKLLSHQLPLSIQIVVFLKPKTSRLNMFPILTLHMFFFETTHHNIWNLWTRSYPSNITNKEFSPKPPVEVSRPKMPPSLPHGSQRSNSKYRETDKTTRTELGGGLKYFVIFTPI